MRNVVKQTVLATGPSQTARRVWHEMVTPREIGYSGAGTVLAVGDQVEGFEIGQPVAYAASGHAEMAAPSVNHAVPVPDGVDLRHAAFVTVGGIAMQALRRADLQFGETVAIYGLGPRRPAVRPNRPGRGVRRHRCRHQRQGERAGRRGRGRIGRQP